uniref:Uncharacterized protein n=1 Tax=Panagrolaimus superbus TaxID=310955 RepID=A0A914YLA4_9BILA
MQYQSLTRWEIGFLTQVFVKYVETVEASFKKADIHRIQYRMKEVNHSRCQQLIKSCARKVAEIIARVEDEVKEKWLKTVENIGQLKDEKDDDAMEE